MYAITMSGHLVTIKGMYQANGRKDIDTRVDEDEQLLVIVARTRKVCVARYLHFFGFTWKERPKSIACNPISIAVR